MVSRLVILSLLGAASTATAEPPRYYQSPQPDVRKGWNIGAGVGAGEISCEGEGCEELREAGSVELQVGTMLRPRLRALAELWAMGHRDGDFSVSHTIVTAGLQYWIIERLWLRGGVGFARAALSYDGPVLESREESETVFGIAGAIGYELLSRQSFALDLQLKGGTGFYDQVQAHNGALAVAVTWY